MKETVSQGKYVGKVATCETHQRSFIIEAGDKIIISSHGNHYVIGSCGCSLFMFSNLKDVKDINPSFVLRQEICNNCNGKGYKSFLDKPQ